MEKKGGRMGRQARKAPERTYKGEYSPRNAPPHPHPHKPSHSTPESALVPGHSGECVAIDGVEVVMVWHIMGEDLSVYHVAFALLTCFVHGLWVEKHHGSKLMRSHVGPRPFPVSLP